MHKIVFVRLAAGFAGKKKNFKPGANNIVHSKCKKKKLYSIQKYHTQNSHTHTHREGIHSHYCALQGML